MEFAKTNQTEVRQNGVARDQGFNDALRDLECPPVMSVPSIAKCDQQPGVGNRVHFKEKPFLLDKSRGPEMAPARRMNGFWTIFAPAPIPSEPSAPATRPSSWRSDPASQRGRVRFERLAYYPFAQSVW
jgi:hypothetical protein